MTKKAETDYTIKVNGMPNYANIPKAVLEPIAKKFLENIWVGRSEKMTKKAETDYTIKVNGMPNYANIPKAVLEPIAKKFLENILREQQEKKET